MKIVSGKAQEEIQKRIKGKQNIVDFLASFDKRKLNLRGANLDGWNVAEQDLSGSILKECSIRNANFGGTNLSDCDLRFTNFAGSNMNKANLKRSNLYGANLVNVSLVRADMTNCSFCYVSITLGTKNLYGVKISKSTVDDLMRVWNIVP